MVAKILLCFCLLALWPHAVWAEVLTFDSPASWQSWSMPSDLVQITDEGQLQLVRFRKEINAAADAGQFINPTQTRGEVSGGIWEAKSSPQTAPFIIDSDPETFWQPDPDDPQDQWSVQIDLGRPVLARQIRLIFPDREGARPLRQFSVFVTAGSRILALDDVYRFYAVYRTPQPNRQTEIVIPLEYLGTDSTYVLDAGMDVDRAYESRFRVVQYIIIEVDEKSEDAALAEVEVLAVGDNVSLGTAERGAFLEGGRTTGAANMFDGNLDTFAVLQSAVGGWLEAGVWWRVDLGAVFFLDELFIYFSQQGEGLRSSSHGGNPSGTGGRFLISDGRPSISSGLPVPEQVDYDVLFDDLCRPQCSGKVFHIRYLFKPRKVRYLLWHEIDGEPQNGGWQPETMLFAEGHPAQVDLRSGFIDLAAALGDDRPKVIKRLQWDADLPSGTRLQLRSRSGNTLDPVYTFYDKKGAVVTEEKWLSSPKVIRGPVDSTVVVGEDWDEWSNVYQLSGEGFKSQSPRRYMQLEVILSTDDPEVAPVVNSLSIEYEEALLQEARGSILPRQANPNEETRFTYTLWPGADARDSGFDILRFTIPGLVTVGDVEVQIGDAPVVPTEISTLDDSLLISLPQTVLADSIRTRFTTRVLANATLFSLDLGSSDRLGLWQSVEPAERRSNIVMLPELADSEQLIGDLEISPLFTPNNDGINDQLEIRFVSFKVTTAHPQVQIYDVSGRLVAELEQTFAGGAIFSFTWFGRDRGGELVAPGVYLCRIDLGAESGGDAALRTIVVAY